MADKKKTLKGAAMDNKDIASNLLSITWQGTIYPEQDQALREAVIFYEPAAGPLKTRMSIGEIGRHLLRIRKKDVLNMGRFRLTKEQETALDEAAADFIEQENDIREREMERFE